MKHEVDPRLVRGLDYYTAHDLRDQDAAPASSARRTRSRAAAATIAWSPRWADRTTPAIGFALGIERALLAIPTRAESYEPALAVFFAPMDEAALDFALPIVHAPARQGHPHRDRAPAGQGRQDDGAPAKLRARAAVIIGSNEIASGKLTVKDLATSTQSQVAVADLEMWIRRLLD